MGLIASKIFNGNVKSKTEEDVRGRDKDTVIPENGKSTTSLMKTPVAVEKFNQKHFISEEELIYCKTKVLKNLKFDPRSPTVGIYRTPIMVEDTDSNKKESDNFNSPVSIYSYNLSNSALQDIVTPSEPSVNVSGFEETKLMESKFDITEEDITYIEVEATSQSETAKNAKPLKIIDRPNTYEARKLLDEIIMSDEENFLKKITSINKGKKSGLKTPGKKIIFDSKGNQLKNRPPLSNITSSTNSPNQIHTLVKSLYRNKVLPEYGAENNVSPNVQGLVQWDKNTTVII